MQVVLPNVEMEPSLLDSRSPSCLESAETNRILTAAPAPCGLQCRGRVSKMNQSENICKTVCDQITFLLCPRPGRNLQTA